MNNILDKSSFASVQREKFVAACRSLPAPGSGCHPALLGAANHGALAGLSEAEIFAALRSAVKPGERHVADGEIRDAVAKAVAEAGRRGKWTGGSPPSRPNHAVIDPRAADPLTLFCESLERDPAKAMSLRESLIAAGSGTITPSSRVSAESPEAETVLFLSKLYSPEDSLYIGDGNKWESPGAGQAACVKTAAEWIEFFRQPGGKDGVFSHIITNPVQPTPDCWGSYRTDAQVADYRYALIEADRMPLDHQIKLLRALRLPVVSLTFSAGKSIHALLDLTAYHGRTVASKAEWDSLVKGQLFRLLRQLGFDPSISNPSRMSRLPGVYRAEKSAWQRLLFVSSEGKGVLIP